MTATAREKSFQRCAAARLAGFDTVSVAGASALTGRVLDYMAVRADLAFRLARRLLSTKATLPDGRPPAR